MVPARVSSLGIDLGVQGSGLGVSVDETERGLKRDIATFMAARNDVDGVVTEGGLILTSCLSFTAACIARCRVKGVLRRRGLPRICSEAYGTGPRISKRKTGLHLCSCT